MQKICLTIAPAFIAARLYLTLSRIVIIFGPKNSRVKPLSYPRLFIPRDVASLLLQAAGGGYCLRGKQPKQEPGRWRSCDGGRLGVPGLDSGSIRLSLHGYHCTNNHANGEDGPCRT